MKVYTLTIVYDDETEEIEYLSEEIEGSAESILEECGAIARGDESDSDEIEISTGFNIIGEA
tara:strand:- start:638 stop:823 length:186 start_codon:yes stop_codon:yes gene_type:complete